MNSSVPYNTLKLVALALLVVYLALASDHVCLHAVLVTDFGSETTFSKEVDDKANAYFQVCNDTVCSG